MVFKSLAPQLQELIKKRGFKEATLPQKQAFKPILEGKNILILAPTGVGKTESAMLPIFDKWLKNKPKPISILYISPLKSLNRDLLKRFLWWGQELGMDISVRHGDTTQYERKKQVDFPDDLLIITPETLQAILPAKRMKEHLRNIKYVVVDEVHEIVSSKRGTQLTVGLERLRRLCGDFQLICLSATVGSPEYVAKFISGNREMKIIKAFETKKMKINVISPEPLDQDKKLAQEIFSEIVTAARLRKIYSLIKKHKSTLTFTNTRDFAEVLTSRLKQTYPDLSVENHHSSLSKSVRIDVEDRFKNQELKAIVATSSLELGIDIGSIDFILQYMSPRQVSKLIQRVGRSGHKKHLVSEGMIITTGIDDIFECAVIAKQALKGEIESLKSHEKALDVLAHQISGILRGNFGIALDEIYSIVKKAYPYRNLTKNEFLDVCNQLNSTRYLFLGDKTIIPSRKGLFYYFENLSTIPDTKSYLIINSLTNEKVGNLDEEFVALHGYFGVTFIIKGEPWKIISVEDRKIYAEPSRDLEAAIPGWEGDLMPVPFHVAQEVGFLREKIFKKLDEQKIQENYPVDKSCSKKMIDIIKKQKEYGIIPTNKRILIEQQAGFVIIHTCLGTKANETLGRFLSAILSEKIGSVKLKTDPYRIILETQIINQELLKEILLKTNPEEMEFYLIKNLSESKLFQWKFIHVARRFGVLRRDAEYGKIRMQKIIDLYSGTPVWKETLREIETDKIDIETVKDFLKKLQSGKLELIFKKGISPLGDLGLKENPEIIGSGKPDLQILDIFENRLMNKQTRLVCLNCGEWSQNYFIKDIPDEIRCPKCKAKLIGVVGPAQIGFERIIQKKKQQIPLTIDEEAKIERLTKTSDLVIVYGKKVIVALGARGVGPRTANRLLRRMYFDKRDFLKALLNAERNYIKNKKYWSA